MRNKFTTLALVLGTGLLASGLATADMTTDFSNPAVEISNQAVMASGACIAKYVAVLDDSSKSATEIGERVAKRCAKEIARSAGMASYIVGKPEQYSSYLKYAREELTTSTVTRARATHQRQLTASN